MCPQKCCFKSTVSDTPIWYPEVRTGSGSLNHIVQRGGALISERVSVSVEWVERVTIAMEHLSACNAFLVWEIRPGLEARLRHQGYIVAAADDLEWAAPKGA